MGVHAQSVSFPEQERGGVHAQFAGFPSVANAAVTESGCKVAQARAGGSALSVWAVCRFWLS